MNETILLTNITQGMGMLLHNQVLISYALFEYIEGVTLNQCPIWFDQWLAGML